MVPNMFGHNYYTMSNKENENDCNMGKQKKFKVFFLCSFSLNYFSKYMSKLN